MRACACVCACVRVCVCVCICKYIHVRRMGWSREAVVSVASEEESLSSEPQALHTPLPGLHIPWHRREKSRACSADN